jgi:malate/lactate dehydrogenase
MLALSFPIHSRHCHCHPTTPTAPAPPPQLSLARAGGSPPALANPAWRTETFEPAVQRRGAAVIAARGLSSAMSAANAIGGHVRDWWLGRAWVTLGG